MILILIVAAVVSGASGEWVDALAILAIVVLHDVIGFVQEQHAEQAMEYHCSAGSYSSNGYRSIQIDQPTLLHKS